MTRMNSKALALRRAVGPMERSVYTGEDASCADDGHGVGDIDVELNVLDLI